MLCELWYRRKEQRIGRVRFHRNADPPPTQVPTTHFQSPGRFRESIDTLQDPSTGRIEVVDGDIAFRDLMLKELQLRAPDGRVLNLRFTSTEGDIKVDSDWSVPPTR